MARNMHALLLQVENFFLGSMYIGTHFTVFLKQRDSLENVKIQTNNKRKDMQTDSMQKTLQDTREALQRLQRQLEQQQQQIERLLEARKNVRR